MASLYQSFIRNLKTRPQGTEPYFAECVTKHLTAAEKAACAMIQQAEAMRAAVRAVKALQRPRGTDPDMDAVQEAVVGALHAIDSWRPDGGSTFSSWLARRAYGAAVDWYRRERAYGMGGRDYIAEAINIEDLMTDDDDGDSPLAVEPIEDLIAEHDGSMIDALVSKLPTELRNIVASYYGYRTPRLTLAELAARENVSIGTIRNRLKEAIAAMQQLTL